MVDWSAVYAELKGWQGAIGSLLGFGALIVGALFNFHLNRKRDERLRNEEIISIIAALYGEIVLIRSSLARMANAVGGRYIDNGLGRYRGDPFDQHFIEQIALPQLRLFPELASKVGILPSELALQIVSFYSRVEESQTWLSRLREDETRPYTYGVNYVLDPALDAIVGVLPALHIMETTAGINTRESMPNIKKALDAQAFEREQFEEYALEREQIEPED